jgi:predicted phosphodiesterase
LRMKSKVILSTATALILLIAAICDGSSFTDWSVLPEHLTGGIVVYGDSRSGHAVHENLVKGMATIEPAAIFHTGDLVSDGRVEGNWITFNNIVSQLPSGTRIYPAMGNHEKEAQRYFDNFELPGNERWYSVDSIPGFNFVVLDTESNLAAGSTQFQWLESELSASVSATGYTIVTFHYPLFSTGKHRSAGKGLADHLVPLFEQYGVDAVFNGHDHNYERFTVNGIRYIVAGGGGAPLRNQDTGHPDIGLSEVYIKSYHFCVLYFDDEQKLNVEVISNKASVIDSFVIEQE